MGKLEQAQEIAKVILKDNKDPQRIKHVGLYGSVLYSDDPQDIDLLVMHDRSGILPHLTVCDSMSYQGKEAPTQPGIGDQQYLKYTTTELLKLLRAEQEIALKEVDDDWVDEKILNQVDEILGGDVDSQLDIIVLDEAVFTYDPESGIYGSMGDRLFNSAQHIARGTSFFRTLLTEGRIFSPETGEFDTPLTVHYADALNRFSSEPAYVRKADRLTNETIN